MQEFSKSPLIKLAQEIDVIDKFDLDGFEHDEDYYNVITPKVEPRRESFNRKTMIVEEDVEQEVQDEETLKLE